MSARALSATSNVASRGCPEGREGPALELRISTSESELLSRSITAARSFPAREDAAGDESTACLTKNEAKSLSNWARAEDSGGQDLPFWTARPGTRRDSILAVTTPRTRCCDRRRRSSQIYTPAKAF